MSPSTFAPEPAGRWFGVALAVTLGVLLALTGFDPDGLPFQPGALFSDAATSHWPSALFLRRSVLEDGAFPLWCPLLMGGQPFAANPLNKVWYPPQWLVLALPPALHLNTLAVLHLALAGVGAWTWGRATGLRAGCAALFGLAYPLAPRLVAALGAGHLDLLYAAAWFPWVLWGVWRCVRRDASARDAIALGLAAALCFLADVRLSAYVFVTAAAYAAWLAVTRGLLRERREAFHLGLRLIGSALIAIGLSAPQWGPLVLLRGELSRGDLSLADAAFGAIEPAGWVGLALGQHGGGPETMVYVGVSVLALAGLAVVAHPRKLALWAIVVLLAALYAMGDQSPLWLALNRLIPPLRWWRVPSRTWLVAALILPYLAAWGAQAVAQRALGGRGLRLALAGLIGGGLACAAVTAIALVPPLVIGSALGVLALPATALAIALSGRLGARRALALLAAIVLADLLWIDRTLLEWRGADEWLEPHRALAEFLRDDGAIRVYSPSYSLPQQAAAYWEIAQFGGVDPFQRAAFVAAAAKATGVRPQGYSVTIPPFDVSGDEAISDANREAVPDADRLGAWLVTHMVADYPLEVEGLALAGQVEGRMIYRNERAPRATLNWDGPNRVTVTLHEDASGPLYAVAASGLGGMGEAGDVGLPGAIQPGEREWTFAAEPDEIALGVAAGAACLALGAIALWGVRRVSR